jgi:hypothetical protein
MDERILAQPAQHSPTDQEQESSEERRSCFYCLSGWVFLGSLDHDGEEIVEAIRCKRCVGTGRMRGVNYLVGDRPGRRLQRVETHLRRSSYPG